MEAQQNAYTPPQGELLATTTTAFCQPRFLALDGRIGRLRYLAYATGAGLLSYAVILIAVGIFFSALGGVGGTSMLILGLISVLAFIPLMVFSWGYLVRRLNDLNHSGWLSLLMLVPLANIGLGLYAIFGKGTDGENKYGAPPPPNSRGVIFLSCIMPALAILGIVAAIAIPAFMPTSSLVEDYEAAAQQTEESFEQNADNADPAAAEETTADDAEAEAEGETSDDADADADAETTDEPAAEQSEAPEEADKPAETI